MPASPAFTLRRVTAPADPALAAFGRVQAASYSAPEQLIPPQAFAPLLSRRSPEREDRLLVAEDAQGEVIGGTLYALLPEAGAGFNSFMAVSESARGSGVARALQRRTLADLRAVGLAGMFADSVHPSRQSPEEREAEARFGTDPALRRQKLHALGLRTVDLPYWQPVGGPDGGPLKDLDLLYAPQDAADTVPLALVTATLHAYWRPWLGEKRAAQEARALAERAGHLEAVPLLPGTETPGYWRQFQAQ
ncbi:hypothetical protein SAMN04488058_107138 [Deinococcus reticulitermitis]|uniref:N-acetyltransferase domain-containing protein n=1 Tax=Deinococcus reticulitermitis TaxID=856736 RepID=A0A1H6YLR9_9DEIO|nr:GNAT family N-acetyltransferase [Deinococcus reticulitermitis]SEJ41336.1 hypothetical protein SAMN04488058_107138 [Deinococcus reticulitermitis]